MIKQVIRFFPIFVDIAVLLLLFCLNLSTDYTLKKTSKKTDLGVNLLNTNLAFWRGLL